MWRRCARRIDAAGHPALLMADTISSLASVDYRHDEWGVDVTVAGSQKGLMLPPGLGFTAVSEKAMKAAKTAKLPKSVLLLGRHGWPERVGVFPYTPATNLLYALSEAIDMLHEEGLARVFARHKRHAEATRRAVRAWGLEILCRDPKCYSPVLTAIPDAGRAMMRTRSAKSCSRISTCRWAPGFPSSPAKCSASAIWATPTT